MKGFIGKRRIMIVVAVIAVPILTVLFTLRSCVFGYKYEGPSTTEDLIHQLRHKGVSISVINVKKEPSNNKTVYLVKGDGLMMKIEHYNELDAFLSRKESVRGDTVMNQPERPGSEVWIYARRPFVIFLWDGKQRQIAASSLPDMLPALEEIY